MIETKKIIIVDDESLIPSLIKELIEGECPELEIAAIATDKDQLLDLVSKNSFDAALIDISIGGREGGIELLRTLKEKSFKLPVVMLSAHDEITYAAKCLGLGAAGYINKAHICNDLTRGLKKVLSGELFVSGQEGERILKKYMGSVRDSILK